MKLSVVLVPLLSVAYAMDLDQLTKRPGHKTKKGKLRQPAETSESSASHGRKKPKFVPLDLSMANEEKGPASSPKIEALLNTSAEQRYFWKRVLDDCEKIDTTKMRNVLRGDKLSPTDALFLTLHDGKERFTKGAAPQCLDKITNYLIKDRKADIVEALDLLTQTDEGSVDYLKLLLENGYVKNDSRGPKTLFSVITKFANIDGGKDLPAALELAFTYDDKKPTDEQVKTFLATDGKVLQDVIMILRDHGHDIPLPKEDGKLADAVLKAVIPEDTVKDGGKMATLEEPEPVEAVDKAHIPVIVVEDEVPRKKDDGLEEGDDIPLPEADEMGIEEPFIPAKDEVVTEEKGEKIEKEESVIPVVDETSEKGNKKPLKDDIVTEKEKVKMQESEPEMVIPTITVIPPEVEIKEGTKKSRRRRTGEKTTEVSPAESTKDDDTLIPPMSEAVRQHSSLVDEFNMSVAELSDEEFAKLIQSIKDGVRPIFKRTPRVRDSTHALYLVLRDFEFFAEATDYSWVYLKQVVDLLITGGKADLIQAFKKALESNQDKLKNPRYSLAIRAIVKFFVKDHLVELKDTEPSLYTAFLPYGKNYPNRIPTLLNLLNAPPTAKDWENMKAELPNKTLLSTMEALRQAQLAIVRRENEEYLRGKDEPENKELKQASDEKAVPIPQLSEEAILDLLNKVEVPEAMSFMLKSFLDAGLPVYPSIVKIAKELELSHPRIDGERMRCLQPTPSRNVDWFDRVPSMVMDGRTEGALFYTLESLQAGASVNEKPEGSKHGSPLEHVINDFNTRVGPLFGALLIRYGAKIEGVKTWTSLSGKKMQSAVQLARKLSTMEPGVIRRALLRLAEADSLYPMWHEYIKFSKNMIEAPSLEKAQEYAVAGLNATLALEIVLLDADSEDEGLDKIIKFWIDKGASICEAVHRVLMRKSRDSDRAKHFEYLVKPSDDRETGGPLESHLLQRQHVHYDDTTLFSSAILIAGENLKYHYDLAAYYEHPKGPSKGDLKELERLAARNEVAKTILESLRQNQSSSVADSQTEDSSTSSAITITPVDETSNASTITV